MRELKTSSNSNENLYKMKFHLLFKILASLVIVLILNACNTKDYYHDRAVRRARAFLLEEDKTLNLAQMEYVKFNKPVIMAAPIFEKFYTDVASSMTLSHVCIAWVIPGKKEAYVVFGVSDNRLKNWTPNRVIVRRYDKPAHKYHAAHRSAIKFAMNNFLYLSPKQLNRIRFEVPETIITDYKFGEDTLKTKKIIKKQLDSLIQITFAWPSVRPDQQLFVCGLGARDLGGWRPIFGGETPTAKLKDHFLQAVAFGQHDPEIYEKGAKTNTEADVMAEEKAFWEEEKVPKVKTIPEVKVVPETKAVPKLKPEVKVVPKSKEALKVSEDTI